MKSKPASTDEKVGGSRVVTGPLVSTRLTRIAAAPKNTTQRPATATGLSA